MALSMPDHAFSEQDLIGHAVAGDKAAFTTLVTKNTQALLEQVSHELSRGDDERTAEIVQQALVDTYDRLPSIDRNRPFIDSVMDAARAYTGTQQKNPEITFSAIRKDGSAEDNRKVADAETEAEDAVSIITAQEAKAALETLLIVEKMKGSRHAQGVSYLFDICANGHSIAQIAQNEKLSPDSVSTSIESACLALHRQLSPIMAPLMR